MVIGEEGLDGKWEKALENGEDSDLETFVQHIISRNLRNSVFVDVTASDKVAAQYPALLHKSIAVVACNKIAASSTYAHYTQLKDLAGEFNTRFLFETNVGAGLPGDRHIE
jgi:aspartokinase/homoserine dehydrogenase 1